MQVDLLVLRICSTCPRYFEDTFEFFAKGKKQCRVCTRGHSQRYYRKQPRDVTWVKQTQESIRKRSIRLGLAVPDSGPLAKDLRWFLVNRPGFCECECGAWFLDPYDGELDHVDTAGPDIPANWSRLTGPCNRKKSNAGVEDWFRFLELAFRKRVRDLPESWRSSMDRIYALGNEFERSPEARLLAA